MQDADLKPLLTASRTLSFQLFLRLTDYYLHAAAFRQPGKGPFSRWRGLVFRLLQSRCGKANVPRLLDNPIR